MTEAEWIRFLQRPEIPAFNRAMLASPDDDLPRLVFADWLDEHCPDERVSKAVRESMDGSPCALHSLPISDGTTVRAVRGRLQLNLESHPPPPGEHGCRALWESGWVGRVEIRDSSSDTVAAWLTHPRMAGVESLEVNDGNWQVAEQVAATERLTSVIHLSISFDRFDLDEVRALVAAKLPALRSLTLFDCQLGDDGAAVLARSPTFAPLTALDLGGNSIGPAGARAIAVSPHLTRLQSLRLTGNAIDDEGVAAIAGSASFAGLTALDLERTELSYVGVDALCRSPHLRNLTTLEIGGNPLGPDVVRNLAACPHLAGLTTLKISSTATGEAGVRALAASPHLRNLRSLDLSSNPIGDAGLTALAASPLFGRLDNLSLGTCGITVAGLRALAASPRFADPRPLELWLTGNAFGEEVQAEADSFPPVLAAAVRNAILWGIDMR